MYDPQTFADTHSATSSQASGSGHTRFDSPDGQTIDLFGPVPVRANLSARQAKDLGLLTSGTYGQRSSISSKSAALQKSLENKLRARTQTLGSTLYNLTWKAWVTPSGRSRFRLRASVRRTSETGFIGWPTPIASDSRGSAGVGKLELPNIAKLAGWASPTAQDGSRGGLPPRPQDTGIPLSQQVTFAGWPTPTSTDYKGAPSKPYSERGGGKKGMRLDAAAHHWLTNTAQPARLTATGEMLTGSSAGMESGGQLSPHMSRWLMGLPPAWCECAPDQVSKKTKTRR